jgi:branched-chain amino acid transport system permease protein
VAISAFVGWVFSRLTLRVNGDYMVVASFALLVIGEQLFTNLPSVTGGGFGVAGIPRPGSSTWQLVDNFSFAVFCIVVAGLTYLIASAVVRSPLGQTLRTLREDPRAAAGLGHFPRRYRSAVFALSSGMAAVAGSLYAHYLSFITPTDFTISLTIVILTIIVVAGSHRLWAVPVGAVVVVALNEVVGYVPLPEKLTAGADQILFGALLVAFALLRPQGIVGPPKHPVEFAAAKDDDAPAGTAGSAGTAVTPAAEVTR